LISTGFFALYSEPAKHIYMLPYRNYLLKHLLKKHFTPGFLLSSKKAFFLHRNIPAINVNL